MAGCAWDHCHGALVAVGGRTMAGVVIAGMVQLGNQGGWIVGIAARAAGRLAARAAGRWISGGRWRSWRRSCGGRGRPDNDRCSNGAWKPSIDSPSLSATGPGNRR